MIKSNNASSSGNRLWLLLFFLFSLNLLDCGGYILVIILGLYLALHLHEFTFTISEVFLFLFGVIYFLAYLYWYQDISFPNLCNFAVAPWMVFWIGRNMAYRANDDRFPLRILSALTLGFFLYGLLSIIYSMTYAPPTNSSRILYKFWNQSALSVTAAGMLFSPALGLAFGTITAPVSHPKKLLGLGILGICVYFSFTWAHRTTIMIAAILAAVNFLAYLCSKQASPRRKYLLVCLMLLGLLVLVLCLVFNWGGCYTWLQEQWLFRRLTDSHAAKSTGRIQIWLSFLREFLFYPLGGKQFALYQDVTYAHNLWFDTYYLCGMIPALALFAVTLVIFKDFHKCANHLLQSNDISLHHVLINYLWAVLLNFMVEPVLEAYPYVFLSFLLIAGSVAGMLQKQASRKNI